jgi:hypothetical protein
MHLVRAPRLLRSPHRLNVISNNLRSRGTVGTLKSIYTCLRWASLFVVSLTNSTSHATTRQAWSWHLLVASQFLDKPLSILGGDTIGAFEAVVHPLDSSVTLTYLNFRHHLAT